MKKLVVYIMLLSMLIMLVGCGTDDSVSDEVGIIDLDNMSVKGNGIAIDGKTINITSGGEYNIFGSLNNGMIYVDTSDSVILSLDNVYIRNDKGPAIYIASADSATIRLTSDEASYIASDVESADIADAIYSEAELIFDGVGSVRICSKSGDGIKSKENVTFDNGDYTIESNKNGIVTDKELYIRSAYMGVYAKNGKGFKAEKMLTVDDGNISLVSSDEGMESKGPLVINGGSINIESSEDGINTGTPDNEKTNTDTKPPKMHGDGKKPPMPEGGEKPPMADGEIPHIPKIDSEFAKAHSITINGGVVFIKAEGDGIDSNGDLTINGGTVIIDGPSARDNGSLDCDGAMTISGGKVLAVSNGGMVQMPHDDDGQKLVCLNVGKQLNGAYIEIKDNDGNVLIDHTSNREFTTVMFSHEKINADAGYSIYINGNKAEAEELSGFIDRHREQQ